MSSYVDFLHSWKSRKACEYDKLSCMITLNKSEILRSVAQLMSSKIITVPKTRGEWDDHIFAAFLVFFLA